MSLKYKPDELPTKIKATIYTHYCLDKYNAGELKSYEFDASGENYVCVAQTPITIKIPVITDLKGKVVAALEEEKKKQMAEHHKKMFELQEKIDSLLCIEYMPQAEENSNVIPF